MYGFLVVKSPWLPPTTKSGIKEHLLKLIVDADLVRFIFIYLYLMFLIKF